MPCECLFPNDRVNCSFAQIQTQCIHRYTDTRIKIENEEIRETNQNKRIQHYNL